MKTASQLANRLGSSSTMMRRMTASTKNNNKAFTRSLYVPIVARLENNDLENSSTQNPLTKLPVAISTGIAISSSMPAHAEDSTVDSAVDAIINIVKAGGDATKAAVSAAQSGIDAAQQAYEQVAPVVKSAVDATAPVVKTAVDAAGPAVQAGVKTAASLVSEAKPSLEKALSSTGIESAAIEKTAGQAVDTAKPLLENLVHFLTTSSPTTLAEVAVGLVASYYLLPPVLKAAGGALRGYAGDVSAAAALDALSTRGDAFLLDIRTAREKEQAGIPDLPNSGKLVELEYAAIEDRRIRGQLRNISELELKITAMQIAALKRLNKGNTIYVLDRNGSAAKAVAKELANRGFSKVFVISGGFSGWSNARLGVKLSSSVSRVEVLLPGSGSFGRQGSVVSDVGSSRRISNGSQSSVRQLPAGRRALPSGN